MTIYKQLCVSNSRNINIFNCFGDEMRSIFQKISAKFSSGVKQKTLDEPKARTRGVFEGLKGKLRDIKLNFRTATVIRRNITFDKTDKAEIKAFLKEYNHIPRKTLMKFTKSFSDPRDMIFYAETAGVEIPINSSKSMLLTNVRVNEGTHNNPWDYSKPQLKAFFYLCPNFYLSRNCKRL